MAADEKLIRAFHEITKCSCARSAKHAVAWHSWNSRLADNVQIERSNGTERYAPGGSAILALLTKQEQVVLQCFWIVPTTSKSPG